MLPPASKFAGLEFDMENRSSAILKQDYEQKSYRLKAVLAFSKTFSKLEQVFVFKAGYGIQPVWEYSATSPITVNSHLLTLSGFVFETAPYFQVSSALSVDFELKLLRPRFISSERYPDAKNRSQLFWYAGMGATLFRKAPIQLGAQVFFHSSKLAYDVNEPTLDGRDPIKTNSATLKGRGILATVQLSF